MTENLEAGFKPLSELNEEGPFTVWSGKLWPDLVYEQEHPPFWGNGRKENTFEEAILMLWMATDAGQRRGEGRCIVNNRNEVIFNLDDPDAAGVFGDLRWLYYELAGMGEVSWGNMPFEERLRVYWEGLSSALDPGVGLW